MKSKTKTLSIILASLMLSVLPVMAQETGSTITITLAMLLFGVGAILAISAQWFAKAKNTRKMLTQIGGITAVVMLIPIIFSSSAIFQADGSLGFLNEPTFDRTANVGDTTIRFATGSGSGAVGSCDVEDTTVTLSGENKFTSVSTGGTHRYRLGSGIAQTVSDGGSFTASPGQTLKVLYGNETDGNYFGQVVETVIPCKGTYNPAEDNEEYGRLVQNSTFTLQIFNEEGNLLNGGTENETLGAGDSVTLDIDIQASNNQGFPHGGVLILDLNRSDYDEAEIYLEFPTLSGRLSRVAVPSAEALDSVANVQIGFEVPALVGATKHRGSFFIDVDDSNNPGDVSDPTFTWIPYDYYVDENNKGAFAGPDSEDEDQAFTFAHRTTDTVHVD